MKPLTLGIVVIKYDENGNVITDGTHFEPTMKLPLNANVEEELKQIQGCDDTETLKHNAEMVLSGWWSKMTEIEFADREKYHIHSEAKSCEKYDNGKIKECTMEISFRER
jgi:hypothetical protein